MVVVTFSMKESYLDVLNSLSKRYDIKKSAMIRYLINYLDCYPKEAERILRIIKKEKNKKTPIIDTLVKENKTHFTTFIQTLMQNLFMDYKDKQLAVVLDLVSIADKWIQKQPKKEQKAKKVDFQHEIKQFASGRSNIIDYIVKIMER